jgi:hypothetical protein
MRPKRIPKPSATLLNDPNQATLPFQQQSIKNFHIAEAARHAAETKLVIEAEAAQKATLTLMTTKSTHSKAAAQPSRALPDGLGSA